MSSARKKAAMLGSLSLVSFQLATCNWSLERRTNRQPKRLSGFAQLIRRPVELQRLLIAELPGPVVGEHFAEGGVVHCQLLGNVLEQAQRVVRVVEPERRVDDGQDHLQLGASRHAWHEVGVRHRIQLQRRELGYRDTAVASAVHKSRATVQRTRKHGRASYTLPKLSLLQIARNAEVGEEGEGHLVDDRN